MRKIPLRVKGKEPRDNRWRQREYSADEIKTWADGGGNIGFRLDPGELVIDIDTKHDDAKGRDSDALEQAIEDEFFCDLSKYPAVDTGGGGRHIYMRIPEDMRILERIDVFGGAVEFKTVGRQVLAPGCIHPNGNPYVTKRKAKLGQAAPKELIEAIERPVYEYSGDTPEVSVEDLKQLFGQLPPEDYSDYEAWRNMMFAAHDASHGSREGLAIFTAWSTGDPDFKGCDGEIRYFWEACTSGRGRTVKTIYREVSIHGGSLPPSNPAVDFKDLMDQARAEADEEEERTGKPQFEPDYWADKDGLINHRRTHNVVQALCVLGFDLSYDEFSNRIFDRKSGRALDDTLLQRIAKKISGEMGTRWSGDPDMTRMQAAATWLAFEQAHHPVREYLEGLKWDGKKRLRTWMIDTCGAEPGLYTQEVSELMLRAAVARIYKPGIKYDMMIVLEGRQGAGKSTLIRHLGGSWTLEGLPPIRGSQEKDVVDAMQGFWFVEVEELSAMRKSDVESLKAFLSRTVDRVRPAYARNSQEFPRQCIFIGTVNNSDYLTDSTGNRRYAPIAIDGEIDITKIDRDQLFAEAVQLYKNDPWKPLALPRVIWEKAAEEAERRRHADSWEGIMADRILAQDKIEHDHFYSTEWILHEIFRIHPTNSDVNDSRRLARAMATLGINKSRGKMTSQETQKNGYRIP